MSFKFYLTSFPAQINLGLNTSNKRGTASSWRSYRLSDEFSGTYNSGSRLTASSVAGPTSGLEFVASGSIIAEWISDPIAANVTVSNAITFTFSGSESSAMANGSPSFLVQRLNSKGEIVSIVIDSNYGAELGVSSNGGSPASYTWSASPTQTTFSKGDRIRVVPYIDDNATTTNMASGYTFYMNFFGPSTSETSINFGESITLLSVKQIEVLKSSPENPSFSDFGASISCSSDGSVLVVGSPYSDPDGVSNAGAVYVYSGLNRATETKLVSPNKTAEGYFGSSIACSSDGSIIIVGAPNENNVYGRTYIFSGTNYSTVKTLVSQAQAFYPRFGCSVACSSDGSKVVVGEYYRDSLLSTHVYVFSGENYSSVNILVSSDQTNGDQFGRAVACSSDASVVVVGAPFKAIGGLNEAGQAYIYSGTNYATETKLILSDRVNGDYFGNLVDCSSDGSIVCVSAPSKSLGASLGTYDGAVYVFSGASYATQTKIISPNAGDFQPQFGNCIKISPDGSSILVTNRRGSNTIYKFSDTNYSQIFMTRVDSIVNGPIGNRPISLAWSVTNDLIFVGLTGASNSQDIYQGSVLTVYPQKYYLNNIDSDIVNQNTDEKKIWTVR